MLSFQIKNISFKVSFSFFALIALVVLAHNIMLYTLIIALSCCVLHELGHVVVMAVLSQIPNEITLYGGGIKIRKNNTRQISDKSELAILLAGSGVNIIISLVVVMFTHSISTFVLSNIYFGIFNLLPLKYFDGGRILLIVFKNSNLIRIVSIIFIVAFAILIVHMMLIGVYSISFIMTFLYILSSEFLM